ncbi:MAG TPA: peptidoglycan-associated lipoprotein Pal [Pseudacidobacterium sp.]|nr:peptidoglycan-associated lipoprotein Pal [Pseudacidobacterium sp.]
MQYAHRKYIASAVSLAALLVVAGCHKNKPAPPPPPPPTVAAPAPTAEINVNPNSINPGDSAVLTWKTTNATDVSIEGVGQVATAGTMNVKPTESTNYHLIARGDGGSADATARLTVNAAEAPASNIKESDMGDSLFHQNVHDIFFDFDAYDIRPDAQPTIQQNAAFLNQHPGIKVLIGGYADERGSTEYNLALGENRANAAKQALVNAGVSPDRLRTVSYGKEKQFCTEHSEDCWQQNRRAQFNVDR